MNIGGWKQDAIIGLIVGIGGILILRSCNEKQVVQDAAWQHSVDSAARVTVLAEKAKLHADTVYDTAKVSYVTYRDRILKSGTATARDTVTFRVTDRVVAACDTARVKSDAVIESKSGELVIARNKPGPHRVVFFGEALYNVVERVPVARLGLDMRLVGPVSLTAQGELQTGVRGQYRALVGVRINLN